MNKGILICAILILLLCLAILRIKIEKNNIEKDRVSALSKKNGKLYTYVYDLLSDKNSRAFADSLDHLIFYDTFRGIVHKNIKNSLFDSSSMDQEYIASQMYTFLPYELVDDNLNKKEFYKCFEKSLDNIFNYDEIEKILVKTYYGIIIENASEAESIEEEAVEYHKQFGEEPPGEYAELHPKETDSDEYIEEEIQERSINYYASMGTVEDL